MWQRCVIRVILLPPEIAGGQFGETRATYRQS
jgi:hypothetical protein